MVATLDGEQPSGVADTGRNGSPKPSLESTARALHADVLEIGEAITRLARIQWLSLRLGARRQGQRLIAAVWLGAVAIALSVTAAVLLALGLASGLGHLLGDRAWAGDLAAGVVLLSAFAGAAAVARRQSDRRHLARTAKSLGRADDKESTR